jgi:hypothetical protein
VGERAISPHNYLEARRTEQGAGKRAAFQLSVNCYLEEMIAAELGADAIGLLIAKDIIART